MKKILVFSAIAVLFFYCAKAPDLMGPEEEVPIVSDSLWCRFDIPEDTVYNKAKVLWESNGFKALIDSLGQRGPVGEEYIYFQTPGWKIITCKAIRDDKDIKKTDSVFVIIEISQTVPIFVWSFPDIMEVEIPGKMEWESRYADSLHINLFEDAGLKGEEIIVFNDVGIKIIEAEIYYSAGTISRSDSIMVIPKKTAELAKPGIIVMIQDSTEWGTDVQVKWETWNANKVLSVTGVSNPDLNGKAFIRFDSTDIGMQIITAIAQGDSGLTATDKDTIFVVSKKTCPTVPTVTPDPILFLSVPDTMEVEETGNIEWEYRYCHRLNLYLDDKLVKTSYDSIGKHLVQFSQSGKVVVRGSAFSAVDSVSKSEIIVIVQKTTPPPPQVDPSISLNAPDSGIIDIPIPVNWSSCNADSVYIPGVLRPILLVGKHDFTFSKPGRKVIYGYAYAGSKSAIDSVVIHIKEKSQSPPQDEKDIQIDDTLFVCMLFQTDTVKVEVKPGNGGYYRIIPNVLYETSENNETFFCKIQGPDGFMIGPENANMGPYAVARDELFLNGIKAQPSGIFHLREGVNKLIFQHISFNGIWNSPPFNQEKKKENSPEKVDIYGILLEFAGN